MITISFLSRLFHRTESVAPPEPELPAPIEAQLDPHPAEVPAPSAACPYCAMALTPPPTRSRLCPHCRQPIALRRVDGRVVLLPEDAVAIFDAQRRYEQDVVEWTAAIKHWLTLAATVEASDERRARLAAAPPSAEAVDASRSLFLSAAEAAIRTARHAKHWKAVSRIRRVQAANLYADIGSPIPPPPDIVDLHRDAMLAELRALQTISKVAELAGTGCCATCRHDEDKTFTISAELRTPRLPHDGCPKGLCGCDWWIAKAGPKKTRRRRTVPAD